MSALRFKNDTEREFWERVILTGAGPGRTSPTDRADALTLLLRERMGTDVEPRSHVWDWTKGGTGECVCGALYDPHMGSEGCPR